MADKLPTSQIPKAGNWPSALRGSPIGSSRARNCRCCRSGQSSILPGTRPCRPGSSQRSSSARKPESRGLRSSSSRPSSGWRNAAALLSMSGTHGNREAHAGLPCAWKPPKGGSRKNGSGRSPANRRQRSFPARSRTGTARLLSGVYLARHRRSPVDAKSAAR